MKKHLPNILLFIVVLANIFFMGMYIRNNGVGMFLSTTGIIFLILGVFIFIFFLSIDPGYGWIKSIDLTKNYIMIFTAIAVSITGVVFVVSGLHLNDMYLLARDKEVRCQELIAGNAAEILKKDWYTLRDKEELHPFRLYLFQKKSNRNRYKIIATVDKSDVEHPGGSLKISSNLIPQPVSLSLDTTQCPGVVERDINIDYNRYQQVKELVQFDVLITFPNGDVPGTDTPNMEEVLVRLQDQAPDFKETTENTKLGTQVDNQGADFGRTS